MATHTMRWTALPVGLGADGRPRLSAHAAFRLDPGPGAEAMLADFPAALEWPRTAVEFTVRFRRGSTIVDIAATLEDGEQRRSDLWSSVFTGAVPVRGFAPPTERSKRRIRTFRTGRLADRWRAAYASLAASPSAVDDHALIGDDPATGPLGAFEAVGFWARSRQEPDQGLGQAMEQQLVTLGYVPATAGGLNAAQLARRDAVEFRRYLDRVRAADPPTTRRARGTGTAASVGWSRPRWTSISSPRPARRTPRCCDRSASCSTWSPIRPGRGSRRRSAGTPTPWRWSGYRRQVSPPTLHPTLHPT
jgi:hypothetical protein